MVFPLTEKCDINSGGLKGGRISAVWPLDKLAKLEGKIPIANFKMPGTYPRNLHSSFCTFHFAMRINGSFPNAQL